MTFSFPDFRTSLKYTALVFGGALLLVYLFLFLWHPGEGELRDYLDDIVVRCASENVHYRVESVAFGPSKEVSWGVILYSFEAEIVATQETRIPTVINARIDTIFSNAGLTVRTNGGMAPGGKIKILGKLSFQRRVFNFLILKPDFSIIYSEEYWNGLATR
ncbi:MAG: hypothetical protein LBV12_03730 [Puniceicoccales bacterium]|jgi:hypothetical protein|nr:hypothetical protein [Puniceicoccales bacterium]